MEDVELCSNCRRNVAAKNFVIHTAHCHRNIQLCCLCEEPIPKKEMEQHMEHYHAMDSCQKCRQRMERWELEKHNDSCSKRPIPCQYCDLICPNDKLSDHETHCGARTEACIECQRFVLLKDKKKHLEDCFRVSNSRKPGFAASERTYSQVSYSHSSDKIPVDDYDCNYVGSKDAAKAEVKHSYSDYKAVTVSGSTVNKFEAHSFRPHVKKNKDVLSVFFDTCNICRKQVPLVDMKTHMAYCNLSEPSVSEEQNIPDHMVTKCGEHIFEASEPPSYSDVVREEFQAKQIESDRFQTKTSLTSLEANKQQCPFCLSQIPSLRLESHMRFCSEKKTKCHFCKAEMLMLEEDQHVQNCEMAKMRSSSDEAKIASSKTGNTLLSDSLKSTNNKSNNGRLSVENSKELCKIQTRLENCPYCESHINPSDYQNHLDQCYKKCSACSFCEMVMLPTKFRSHIEKECEKAKQEWKTVLSNTRSSRNNRRFTNKKFEKFFEKNNKGRVSTDVTPEQILLPCEFCEALFPEDAIIQHQSGCRPDLVHFSKKNVDEDCVISNASQSLPSLDSEHVRRKIPNRKNFTNSDVFPGEYLSTTDIPTPMEEKESLLETYNAFKERNYSGKQTASDNVLHSSYLKSDFNRSIINDVPNSFSEEFQTFDHSQIKQHSNLSVSDSDVVPCLKYLNMSSDEESDGPKMAPWLNKEQISKKNGAYRDINKCKKEPLSQELSLNTHCYGGDESNATVSIIQKKQYNTENKISRDLENNGYDHFMSGGARPKKLQNLNDNCCGKSSLPQKTFDEEMVCDYNRYDESKDSSKSYDRQDTELKNSDAYTYQRKKY